MSKIKSWFDKIKLSRNSYTAQAVYVSWIVLISLSAFLLFYNLGTDPFLDYDEAAYAEVVKETFDRGNVFTLYFAGEPWIDKPPLYIWASKLFLYFFEPELALRLFSALAGFITVFMTWLIAYTLIRKKSLAFLTSFILISTPAFIETARQAKQDIPVTLFILSALYCFLKYTLVEEQGSSAEIKTNKNSRWLLGIGISIALGIMTKNVIGFLAIPLIGIFLFCSPTPFKARAFLLLKNIYFWIGNFIGFCIAAPWHIFMAIKFGQEFFDKYVLKHVVTRYSENLFGTDDTWLIYGYYLYNFAAPWIWIFLGLCVFISSAYLLKRKYSQTVNVFILSSVWVLFILVIFSFSKTKVPYYLTPIYPFIALSISSGIYILYKKIKILHEPKKITLSVLSLLFLSYIFIFGLHSTYSKSFRLDVQFNYYTRTSYEEREIGYLLAERNIMRNSVQNSNEQIPILFYDSRYWETIRYYSGGLKVGQYTEGIKGPYYLIVPIKELNNVKILKVTNPNRTETVEKIYTGRYFVVLYKSS